VLRVHTSGMPLGEDVNLAGLAADTERFSGIPGVTLRIRPPPAWCRRVGVTELSNHSSFSASGAELAGLCHEAAIAALREDLQGASEVAERHFLAARAARRPSLTPAILGEYESWSAGRRKPSE